MAEKTLLQEIGLPRAMRYSYGGVLLCFIVAVLEPKWLTQVSTVLGLVLAPLVVLAIGIGIYVVHRQVIGEAFLYHVLHGLHLLWDRFRERKGEDTTDTISFLKALGVKSGEKRSAYAEVRRRFFNESLRTQLELAHGELHVLWITVDQLVVAGVYVWVVTAAKWSTVAIWFAGAGLVAVCAALADIRQHQQECHLFRSNRERLVAWLKKAGYVKTTQA